MYVLRQAESENSHWRFPHTGVSCKAPPASLLLLPILAAVAERVDLAQLLRGRVPAPMPGQPNPASLLLQELLSLPVLFTSLQQG